jgi:FdrA protein
MDSPKENRSMPSACVIRRNQYYDSVFLMAVGGRLAKAPGVRQTAVLMASEKNKETLAGMGFGGEALDRASPNDLFVGVIGDSQAAVDAALAGLDAALQAVDSRAPASALHTLEEGLRLNPRANLAVITIPGEYVRSEARKALEAGLHTFIFSSNVPPDVELELKQLGQAKGLLVMGPDCGTSILHGVGLGFANAVRRGPIGAVGPSGTGLQEFTCLVHHAGSGIAHAIGTGSHDLSDDIGGITTWMALQALESDPQTSVIAIVAKPAGRATLARLMDRLQACRKPVVVCILGMARPTGLDERIHWADIIDEAAIAAVQLLGDAAPESHPTAEADGSPAFAWDGARVPAQRYLRGLFAGGTMCYQSQQILLQAGLPAYSNAPLDRAYALPDPSRSCEHTLIDMGDDAHTLARPHPMIDGTLRAQRILAESVDPEVAILLLDFVLGYNASPDPVGDVLGAIEEGRERRRAEDGRLKVVASVCGSETDPQDLASQVQKLRRTGVEVFHSNARATEYCVRLLQGA